MNYRFALRPAWIVSHLFVIALVVLFVNLGLWQLRRLDERRAFNDVVEANVSAQPVALPAELDGAVDEFLFRPVRVEGRYVPDADILVANRTVDGQPGFWVVTPLAPVDGSPAVAVVRGFVTRAFVAEGDLLDLAPPDGDVVVTGYVQESRSGGRFAQGLDESELPEITTVDVEALAEEWATDLAPVWLQLRDQQPEPSSDELVVIPPPDLDEGPHLSYAVQWFIFATIGVIGYPLILRRNARVRSETAG